MTYNITQIASNTTGVLGMVQGVNEVLLFGWMGNLFLLGFAVVIFMAFSFSTQDPRRSLAATAYISFVLSLLLRAVDLVPNTTLYITLILTASMVAFTFRKE